MKSIIFLNKIFLGIFLGFIFTFSFEGSASALSIDDEKKLGEVVFEQVRRQFEFVEDDFAKKYIEELGKHLTSALEIRHFPYHFYVINDSGLNAFAAPGGHIFIFSGLIEVMDSADELAGVLSHELAHAAARHISHRIELNKKIGLASLAGALAGVLIGGEAGGLLSAGSTAAGIQAQLHYSRNDEREADILGFKYARETGFDTSGLVTVLNKIQQSQLGGSDQIPPYLLTHPSGPERMSNIEIMIRETGQKRQNMSAEKYRLQFPYFKTILKAKYLSPEVEEEFFKNILVKNPDDKLALFGLGLISQRELRFPASIDYLQRALKQDPEALPILKSLGETYQMEGDHEKAVDILEKARQFDREDGSTIYLLALSHLELEHYQEAVQLFEKLTYMEPLNNQVYYQLGLSYGRQNKHARAHYYFGLFFKNEMKKSKADFHFTKARELARNDQELIKLIDQATAK